MAKLSTHVLDTMQGKPAAGMLLSLWHQSANGDWVEIVSTVTNADGRTDQPLLSGDTIATGDYELRFVVNRYFASQGIADAGRFLNIVPINFRIDDEQGSYHVPLLVSPWAYSTYRGS
jgi:5-hydroxyisourate hydrolase